ncbi:MAG: ferritin family protein, partial [bacterium]
MSQWSSADEILDFAINNEEEAAKFYTDLAGKMDSAAMREVFEDFAQEEKEHKAKLLGVKHSGKMEQASEQIHDLKIGDYLV